MVGSEWRGKRGEKRYSGSLDSIARVFGRLIYNQLTVSQTNALFLRCVERGKERVFSRLGPMVLPLVGEGVIPLFSHSYYFKQPFGCPWAFFLGSQRISFLFYSDIHGYTKRGRAGDGPDPHTRSWAMRSGCF
jgi:hypothetical protein